MGEFIALRLRPRAQVALPDIPPFPRPDSMVGREIGTRAATRGAGGMQHSSSQIQQEGLLRSSMRLFSIVSQNAS